MIIDFFSLSVFASLFCQRISLFVYKKASICFGLRRPTDKYLHGVIYSRCKNNKSSSPKTIENSTTLTILYFLLAHQLNKKKSIHFNRTRTFFHIFSSSYFQTNHFIVLILFLLFFEWISKFILRNMITSTDFRTLLLMNYNNNNNNMEKRHT